MNEKRKNVHLSQKSLQSFRDALLKDMPPDPEVVFYTGMCQKVDGLIGELEAHHQQIETVPDGLVSMSLRSCLASLRERLSWAVEVTKASHER